MASSGGAVVSTLRSNDYATNGITPIGRHHVAACLKTTAKMRFWSWSKGHCLDAVLPEKCMSVCASPSGTYLFAGGKSGKLYVWELTSGMLLCSWNAHYKAATRLKVDATGTLLVSGGEDAVLHLWLVPELLDPEPGRPPHPHHSWSGHTLPIMDLSVISAGASAKFVSVSMDCSCRIWSIASEEPVASYQLPCPLLSVAIDRGQRAIYCGGQNGEIYELPLMRATQQQSHHQTFKHHHEQGVQSLDLTVLMPRLVSGSLDGIVRLWDLRSRQCLKMLSLPGKKPVSHLFVAHGLPQKDDSEAFPAAPLVGISRYPRTSLRKHEHSWEEGPLTVLSSQREYSGIAHVFLNPDESPSAPHGGLSLKHSQPEKIPLSGGSEEKRQIDMTDQLTESVSDIKSLVSQILHQDQTL